MSDTNRIEATKALIKLAQTPEDQRDIAWKDAVMALLPQGLFRYSTPNLIQGPDGFDYFVCFLPKEDEFSDNKSKPIFTSEHINDCLDQGLGIAIFNDEEGAGNIVSPLFILSYGSLISFKYYQTFTGDPDDIDASADGSQTTQPLKVTEISVSSETEHFIAAPSENFLDESTKKHLDLRYKDLFGFQDVGVLLILTKTDEQIRRSLVVSLKPQDFENEETIEEFLWLTHWYLPPGRSFMLNFGIDQNKFSRLVPKRGLFSRFSL